MQIKVSELTTDFISFFGIQQIIEEKPQSGQKQVYIVKIKDVIYALKVIPNADERIFREISIGKEFKNINGIPNILRTEQFGNSLVIIEEYIEGNDLSTVKDAYFKNSLKIRKLIFDIATILEPLWKRRCVHRDLKPQNILIRPDESPVVLDFGIVRDMDDGTITPTGFQPFTWCFASPEQYFSKRDQISYRTDFFCLGIIAYYLFTGTYPFGENKTAISTCFQEPQKQFDLGEPLLNRFLNEALKYRVAERPRTIDQFINYLNI